MVVQVVVARTGRHLQRYNKGRRQVVGCIPYRYKDNIDLSMGDEDAFEVLLISPQRKGKGLLFPKGGWEKDETIEVAARRETIEEAGVCGDIEGLKTVLQGKLGTWYFENKSGDTAYEGHMFPLFVREELNLWPEKDIRERSWMSVREARKLCQQGWMKEALELLVSRLTSQCRRTKMDLFSRINRSSVGHGTILRLGCRAQVLAPPPPPTPAEEA
ncbi:Nudix hydrolase 21, chloroplastic [Capsicum annuum]|uniref:Nudix hydrolase 21, chloroplastic n=1 Tax=Capsicum annuum TaxID=4072 RepID=A0A2G2ZFK0_CAPAN|nr:Nudix hydrolase 21, chloroplastic [Capsicum annuum]